MSNDDERKELSFKVHIRTGAPVLLKGDRSHLRLDDMKSGLEVLVPHITGGREPMTVLEPSKVAREVGHWYAESECNYALIEFDEESGEWVSSMMFNKAAVKKIQFDPESKP